MGYFGDDFIYSSILWLCITFIFIFLVRKKIFKRVYKDGELDKFILILKKYLDSTYTKINFEYKIEQDINKDENPDAFKYSLCDDIINQYHAINFNPRLQQQLQPKEMWATYAYESKPVKDKLPKDWLKRKNAIYDRDEKACQRCSKEIASKDAELFLITPVNEGGEYFIENIVLLCSDCSKIENQKRDDTKINFLHIKDDLYDLV